MLSKLSKNHSHFYQVAKTKPKKIHTFWAKRLWHFLTEKKHFVVILGVLLISGMVFGYMQFKPKEDKASASESGNITAGLKLKTDQKLEINSPVNLTLTMQNTSNTESLNGIKISLTNTLNAVKWTTAQNINLASSPLLNFEKNDLTILNLSAGERVEYQLIGTLQNNQIPLVAIIAGINYTNKIGSQKTQTNRVIGYLKTVENQEIRISVKTSKDKYENGEKIILAVDKTIISEVISNPNNKAQVDFENTKNESKNETKNSNSSNFQNKQNSQNSSQIDFKDSKNQKISGKIFISDQATGELANSLDCQIEIEKEMCNVETKLEIGNYSAIFVANNEAFYSSIKTFSVGKVEPKFEINPQATLQFPFGNSSQNGQIAVIATKVLSGNTEIKTGFECTFTISKDDKVVNIKTPILPDKTCNTSFSSDQINSNGTYKIGLVGTNYSQEINFEKKEGSFWKLKNKSDSNLIQKDKELELINENKLEDAEKTPINDQKVEIIIFHPSSGGLREFNPNSTIKVKDGSIQANIPFENFKELGNYKIWGKLENGQISDILDLVLQDKSIGMTTGGITFDYKELIAGQQMTFNLSKLEDSMGNTAADGQCGASLYQSSKNVLSKGGFIKNGICSITFGKGEVKTAGNALISFGSGDVENKINQSRQINILPSGSVNFGKFSGEYEPVRRDFTNNFVIGPATDNFGNLINAENLTLEIVETKFTNPNVDFENNETPKSTNSTNNSDKNDPRNIEKNKIENSQNSLNVRRLKNITIQNGFGKVEVPASFLDKENLTFRLISEGGKTLIIQDYKLVNSQEKIILPIIPEILKTEENLKLTIDGLKDKLGKCELYLQNSMFEIAKTEMEIGVNNKCVFDWDVQVLRNQKFALVEVKIGQEKFAKVIEIKAQTASNLFVVSSQVFANDKSEILLNLLTSPIMDKYGRNLENEKLKWQYNGKKIENLIQDGIGKLELTMDKLGSKDFKNNGGKKTLNLDIDVKAGTTSISKTNNLELVLGNFEITNQSQKVEIIKFSNILRANIGQVFQFKTKNCQAILNKNGQIQKLPTHSQNGNCFVEIKADIGNYKLIFEENGFASGEFDLKIALKVPEITICQRENDTEITNKNTNLPDAQTKITNSQNSQDCAVSVKGTNNQIKVKILDGEKEYKFISSDLENTVKIKQNGLNSNKKYLVIVETDNEQKDKIIWQEMVLGSFFGQ